MTILEALSAVNTAMPATAPTFIYADLNEANFSVDTLTDSQVPVNVILPITVVDTIGKSGAVSSAFDLQGFMLTKISNLTTDYNSSTVETSAIAPMRLLARQFLHRLNEHSIIDPQSDGIKNITYQPIYSSMDANLFGVFYRVTVPVLEVGRVCVP